MKLLLIHAPGVDIEVEKTPDKYAPRDAVYLMDANWQDPKAFMRTLRDAERERDMAIARYENVLKGLRYWQARSAVARSQDEG